LPVPFILNDNSVGANCFQARPEANVDPAFGEQLVGKRRQRLSQFRENALAALEQDQAQIFFRDVVIGVNGFAQKVIHFRDAFDAGKTSTGDDEGKKTLSHRRIGFGFGFLQRMDELIAQIKSISQILEGMGMFAHAGNFRMIQARAHGDDQMIVMDRGWGWPRTGAERYGPLKRVDRFNIAGKKIRSRRHAANRSDHVI
jgi:hypothetical protein